MILNFKLNNIDHMLYAHVIVQMKQIKLKMMLKKALKKVKEC